MKTVQYTASYLLSCAQCNGTVILCVADTLTASGFPYIEATVSATQEILDTCGRIKYTYDLTYDEGDLSDPNYSLVEDDIEGVTCKGCLTDYIESLVSEMWGAAAEAAVAAVAYPPGTICEYGGDGDPTGWFICDGRAVSRLTYANLFTALGTKYGVGDGVTTFNIPDFQDTMPIGVGVSVVDRGVTGGTFDHTHTGPSHSHGMGAHVHTGPSHTHTLSMHTHDIADHTHGPGDLKALVGVKIGASNDVLRISVNGLDPFDPDYKATLANSFIADSDGADCPSTPILGNTAGAGVLTSSVPSTNISGSSGTSNTGMPNPPITDSGGTGATGTSNPPYLGVNFIIKY